MSASESLIFLFIYIYAYAKVCMYMPPHTHTHTHTHSLKKASVIGYKCLKAPWTLIRINISKDWRSYRKHLINFHSGTLIEVYI